MTAVPSTRLLSWLLAAVVIFPLALFIQAGFATYSSTREANDKAIQRSTDLLAEYVLRLMETVQAALREGERLTHELSDEGLLADVHETHRSFAQIAAGLPHVRELSIADAHG